MFYNILINFYSQYKQRIFLEKIHLNLKDNVHFIVILSIYILMSICFLGFTMTLVVFHAILIATNRTTRQFFKSSNSKSDRNPFKRLI